MTRVYLADAQQEERSALRLVLMDLNLEVVGEAEDWLTTLTRAPATYLDMLLVDWLLLPTELGAQALAEFRLACSMVIVIVLTGQLEGRRQEALSAGADAFINKGETPERVTEHLRTIAASVVASEVLLPAVLTAQDNSPA